jgi:hypothetical protein
MVTVHLHESLAGEEDLETGHHLERTVIEVRTVYVRHVILSHRRVCVESNDKACSAGVWPGINGNQEPILLKYVKETMYWLVSRPAAKDYGNSAADI